MSEGDVNRMEKVPNISKDKVGRLRDVYIGIDQENG